MNPLEEAAAALQIGVRKATPVRSGRLDPDPSESPEKTALVEAGLLDLTARAGATVGSAEKLSSAPPEVLKVAHTAPLDEALASEPILLEWAKLAAERGFIAPPKALPGLLKKMARHPREIAPVLGERGRWMAALMDIPIPVEEVPERAEMGPEYEAMAWGERATAIARLREGLSPVDEPLLLHALLDRRKEVRSVAADLIVRLPNTTEAKSVITLVEAAIGVKRSLLKTSLNVALPEVEALPSWLPRGAWAGVGPKAAALADIVAHTPPSAIERSTGLSRQDLVQLAQKSEFSRELLDGFQEGALRFDDQEWIDTLFAVEPPVRGEIWRRASESAFDAVVVGWLKGADKALNHTLAHLPQRSRTLSPVVSRAIMAKAQKAEHPYLYTDLGRLLDLSLLPLLREPWADEGTPEKIRQAWYPALDLRTRLRNSLQ